MRFCFPFRASAIALLAMSLAGIASASPQAQSPSSQAGKEQEDSSQTFKVQVNVVNLFFNVKDKHGALVPSLAKNDFQVFEDGKPQTVKYFAAESNQPLTLGILIDSSVSQTNVLPAEKDVGSEFLREVLREKDLAFVIGFDVNVDLLQDLTNSPRLLRTGLESARINGGGVGGGPPGLGGGPFPTSNNPKGTLLYDAVYLAANEKLASEVGRKAMILLTDGEDQGSQMKIKDAIEAAQKADSICYVILIADRGFYWNAGMGYGGAGAMKKLATETGGRVIEVGNKRDKLKEAFDQIASELRSQYNIGYTPTNNKQDGTFRKVEIKTTDKEYKVQARTGYYAIKSSAGD